MSLSLVGLAFPHKVLGLCNKQFHMFSVFHFQPTHHGQEIRFVHCREVLGAQLVEELCRKELTSKLLTGQLFCDVLFSSKMFKGVADFCFLTSWVVC